MLRIILLIVISYIIIRIALRLLLTESPMQRRSQRQGSFGTRDGSPGRHPYFRAGEGSDGRTRTPGQGGFDDIADAEFEEIPPKESGETPRGKKK